MLLIYILIVVFMTLLVCQVYKTYGATSLIEGLENADTTNTSLEADPVPEYKPYNLNNPNNALILAQQNAGNIEVLRGRIDELDGVKKRVDNMQQSIDIMQTQLNGLAQQQAEYAQELAGSTPPTISGTEPETADNI